MSHNTQTKKLVVNFFIVLVITFTLFVPVSLYIVWKNINELNNVWNKSAEISLYLKKNINQEMAVNLAKQLRLNDAIMDIKLITPNEGIRNLAKHTGFGEILLGFKENPLPYVIIVYPKLSELTESQIRALVDSLKNISKVETTKIDMDWVLRSYNLLNLWKYLSFILGLILGIGALVTFCFTIYITSDITGRQCFWHSLISGALALLLINFILMKLHDLGFIFQGLGGRYSAIFIILVVLLNIIICKFSIKNRNE